MATTTYKSGPISTVRVNTTGTYNKGDWYASGRLTGFVLTPPNSNGDMVIQVEGEFYVDFAGTTAVTAGDTLEWTGSAFDKLATPTAAHVIALEDHAASAGTIRVLLVPGLKL